MEKILKTSLLLLLLFALTGCASLAGRVGLASETFVKEQLQVLRTELETDFAENKQLMDNYAATAARLEELIASMEGTVKTTDELKNLAVILEDRLEDLPKETIRQLVEILNNYLEGK